MIQPHTFGEVYEFLCNDFTKTWDQLSACDRGKGGGGNFLFALLSIILLEFAAELAADKKGRQALGQALNDVDSRYYIELPLAFQKSRIAEVKPSHVGDDKRLIFLLFDLIRNGKAHLYQSTMLKFSDGRLDLAIRGPATGRQIGIPQRTSRAKEHLRCAKEQNNVWIYFRPDQFFLDLRGAIDASGILTAQTGTHTPERTFKTLGNTRLATSMVPSSNSDGPKTSE